MFEWLDKVAGPGYTAAILWTFAALVLLVIVLVIVKLIRSLTFGTFVAGGRNRKTRLAVMDATAVDSQRRLVLVRRDDIEHLLLIGGPTDVVVERDIRMSQPRRPALTATEGGHEVPQAPRPQAKTPPSAPTPRPAAHAPARPSQPQQPAPAQGQNHVKMPAATAPTLAPNAAPQNPATPTAAAPTYATPQRPVQALVAPMPSSRVEPIDDTLINELQVSLDDKPQPKPTKLADHSLDDEMAKLLGELSSQKK
ncbi:hypothetical protein [Mesorhizobium sp. ANAO-SY3R2]|uniref:hypothetical protein n=1 Tax=Mesorhizobium sp. ANAO-SY3R2 TaxID=3166644 RepID=UPI003672666F